jgi:hypothetical protein
MTQSNYIPWRGYFDMIDRADAVVLYDDAQYTRRDWRNRNRIKTEQGTKWLTIPVKVKGKYEQSIYDTEIADRWAQSHWSSIQQAYRDAPFFESEKELFSHLFVVADHVHGLSKINRLFLEGICDRLGITTPILDSSSYHLQGSKSERLLNVCRELGASSYISGPAAREYLDTDLFAAAGIEVEWMSFQYAEYPQLHGDFEAAVSVIDLLFNAGPAAPDLIRPLPGSHVRKALV